MKYSFCHQPPCRETAIVFQKIKFLLISKDLDPAPSFQQSKHRTLVFITWHKTNKLQPTCLQYSLWNASQNINRKVGINQLKHSNKIPGWRKHSHALIFYLLDAQEMQRVDFILYLNIFLSLLQRQVTCYYSVLVTVTVYYH